MSFRADIVKMVEDLVTKIEEHHFKVNSSMKQDFITFVNSFFKYHLDQTDINFTLNANMLYADTDGVKVIIATDSTMAFAVPGCTIPMRDQIEAFIVIDEVVAYDSYKMRRFRKAIQTPPAPAQPTAPAAPHNVFTTPAPAPSIFNAPPPTPSVTPFNAPTPPASTPATTTFSTPATTATTPPATTTATTSTLSFSTTPTTPTSSLSFPSTTTPAPSSFNFSTAPAATSSAFHLSAIPVAKPFGSPTNLFSTR